jgi:hypothetical protein
MGLFESLHGPTSFERVKGLKEINLVSINVNHNKQLKSISKKSFKKAKKY